MSRFLTPVGLLCGLLIYDFIRRPIALEQLVNVEHVAGLTARNVNANPLHVM